MSVEISFEQDGGHGLVATGTSLWEAAKRLGIQLRADCNGRGECDACAVLITSGAHLLSPANERERKMLGDERLIIAQRLACQATLDRSGAVSACAATILPEADKQNEPGKAFRELTTGKQVSALIELQAVAITEAVNTLRGKSNALIEKFLNLKSQPANATKDAGNASEGSTNGERQATQEETQEADRKD